jgi:hypothetical protein
VPKAHDYRVAVSADRLSVGSQVSVIHAGSNSRQADMRRIHLHKWYGIAFGCDCGESGLEGLKPSAVIGDQSWLDSSRRSERCNPPIRSRDPIWIQSHVGVRTRRQSERRLLRRGRRRVRPHSKNNTDYHRYGCSAKGSDQPYPTPAADRRAGWLHLSLAVSPYTFGVRGNRSAP